MFTRLKPILLCCLLLLGTQIQARQTTQSDKFESLVREFLSISPGMHSEAEYQEALKQYKSVLQEMEGLSRQGLSFDEQIDLDLAIGKAKTKIYEIETVQLYKYHPVNYFQLGSTNGHFVQPMPLGAVAVRMSLEEMKRLPVILENAKKNLTNPARIWTENAIYQAYYAKLLLKDYVPTMVISDEELKKEVMAAAETAWQAVDDYENWLRVDLLPRSIRDPGWNPEYINYYQTVHEQLVDYDVDEMLRIAEADAEKTMNEMKELAKRIHPSGDLHTVWDVMKDEAPPYEEVVPMAERFVEMTANWLKSPQGSHVIDIPDFDYGVQITAPMGRRTLSFGGATYGPTLNGRLTGYYVITPLEDILTEREKASRIRAYNPYWTHVISYHEWLGHTVQRAAARLNESRPMRLGYGGIYLSQAWSFYLERLLEEEGYFDDLLDHTTNLKTRMGRLQMRMWRIQRILTKLKMAKGEMTFEEAVQDYIDKVGIEWTNSYIEVQRDSQTPSPPGREIIGELFIVNLREEMKKIQGDQFDMRAFHNELLSYGDIPLPAVRKLMMNKIGQRSQR